jgi:hypothetical protein
MSCAVARRRVQTSKTRTTVGLHIHAEPQQAENSDEDVLVTVRRACVYVTARDELGDGDGDHQCDGQK